MPTPSSTGHDASEAWLPLVVDCVVCETTHALVIGHRRGCPFEGLHRASPTPGRHRPIPPSDSTSATTPLTGRFLR